MKRKGSNVAITSRGVSVKRAHLASSNHIVWSYFEIARVLATEARNATAKEKQGKIAVVILVCVAAVEAFVNVFGRLWAEQEPAFAHAAQIDKDLAAKKFVTKKIKEWPVLFFGKKIDFSSGAPARFLALIEKRNSLMHFASDSHSVHHDGITIHGLVDSAPLDSLSDRDAKLAISAAEDFIESWVGMQGLAKSQIAAAMHHWIGRVAPPS